MYDSEVYGPTNIANSMSCSSCSLIQVITINEPINSIDDIIIYKSGDYNSNDNCKYDNNSLKFSHSIDQTCWSCWNVYSDELQQTINIKTDFFIKFQVQGTVSSIYIKDYNNSSDNSYIKTFNWSSQVLSGFNFTGCDGSSTTSNPNQYNPYANMECAIKLQQQLSETVACMFGIPIYYFKVSGIKDSADITFKEYALKSVTSVKQIKMVIKDGVMPSSKPDFNDFGIDWQSDWEVEITKNMFATAFGNTEQPTEGDLVYVPMMKRMWQVNEAYDEKNDSLMWVSTTFKLALVKYQDEMIVDKETTGFDAVINNIVKNKYEDLFGDQESLDSGIEAAEPIDARPDNMIPVFESDSCRRYISVKETEIKNQNQNASDETSSLYYKGTLISDSYYEFSDRTNININKPIRIEYQRQYCGDELSISFIIKAETNILVSAPTEGILMSIGNIKIKYDVKTPNSKNSEKTVFSIYNINNKKLKIDIEPDNWYLIVIRSSKKLGTCDISSYIYTYPNGIPQYKLRKFHYYFDIDNGNTVTTPWNDELVVQSKQPVYIYDFGGCITNIKVADVYIDDISHLMMQYPTNQHMLINDTARQIYGLLGVKVY